MCESLLSDTTEKDQSKGFFRHGRLRELNLRSPTEIVFPFVLLVQPLAVIIQPFRLYPRLTTI